MHFLATAAAAAAALVIMLTFYVSESTAEDDGTTASALGVFQVGLVASDQAAVNDNSPQATGVSCGRSKYSDAGNMQLPAPLIVGGQQARQYEFPWQVSMRYLGSHRCGGSIIAQSWILTAAHCVSDLTSSQIVNYVTIIVGEYKLSDTASAVRQVFRVAAVSKGDYNSSTEVNDIALLQLSGSITFTENVAPVCLPVSTSHFDFRKSVASGWGVTRSGSSTVSNVLLYTTLNITTNNICNSIFYSVYRTRPIFNSMMCTRDNIDDRTRDTCQGDSGGPLAVRGSDGTFTLAGITSWGMGCAAGIPGVYTRVSSFVDSIYDIITKTPSAPTPVTTKTTKRTSTTTRCYYNSPDCGLVNAATVSCIDSTLKLIMPIILSFMTCSY